MKRFPVRWFVWGLLGCFVLLVPYLFREIRVIIANEVLIYALFAVSFNLLFGYTGLLPFGHAGMFGVGAYSVALMINHFPGMPLLATLFIACLAGFTIAVIVGFFCVRLSGAYFALISLSFQMFLFAIAYKWRSVTNGDDGMSVVRPDLQLPFLGNISLHSIHNLYYLTLVLVVLGIAACYLLLKTPFGNAIVCVREKDVRASYLGYNVFLVKLTSFAISGLLAGLAGGLFALYQDVVATTCIDNNMSMVPVLMVIIGGSTNFFGPLLGAAFYVILQDWMSSVTNYWMIIMGGIFILIILYLQDGLAGLFTSDRIWRRRGSK
jgi:branched-chain amino acid transport system permease protein